MTAWIAIKFLLKTFSSSEIITKNISELNFIISDLKNSKIINLKTLLKIKF